VTDDQVRRDLAFIREAIEEGRAYATRCGPDLLVWGIAVTLGYLGTYAFVRGWSTRPPNLLWAAAIGVAWLYSLRRLASRLLSGGRAQQAGLAVVTLRLLWLGCGIFLTTLWLAAMWSGELRFGWFNAVVAGTLGVALFVTAQLASLPWLRWVAIAWWAGELVLYALRQRPEALLVAAALMLLLLAGPGLVLVLRQQTRRPA
jgi:hypothetical protein